MKLLIIISFLFGPNIPLSTLFPHILSVYILPLILKPKFHGCTKVQKKSKSVFDTTG
jgi:hypothetical protein